MGWERKENIDDWLSFVSLPCSGGLWVLKTCTVPLLLETQRSAEFAVKFKLVIMEVVLPRRKVYISAQFRVFHTRIKVPCTEAVAKSLPSWFKRILEMGLSWHWMVFLTRVM